MKFLIALVSISLFACPQLNLRNLTCFDSGASYSMPFFKVQNNVLSFSLMGFETTYNIPSTIANSAVPKRVRCSGNSIVFDYTAPTGLKTVETKRYINGELITDGNRITMSCIGSSCKYESVPVYSVCR